MSTFGGGGGGAGGPMPYSDDKMPFYALGVNLALQIGQQANIKTLLEDDEIDIVLEAFCDHVRGTSAQDPRAILVKYGQDLNTILSGRNDKLVDRIKADGKLFCFCCIPSFAPYTHKRERNALTTFSSFSWKNNNNRCRLYQ
jgi:hypothetical protein